MEPTILHADLDAFYASVEQLLNPKLRGRPVLVGGGVVVTASYEARAFGVKAPMPTRDALRLCPRAVVVEGAFGRYLELSDRVMAIFEDATPLVEQISIDEAFLDVSGTTHLLGKPSDIAREMRRRVRDEVGLPLSVGVASTKFLAKIASVDPTRRASVSRSRTCHRTSKGGSIRTRGLTNRDRRCSSRSAAARGPSWCSRRRSTRR